MSCLLLFELTFSPPLRFFGLMMIGISHLFPHSPLQKAVKAALPPAHSQMKSGIFKSSCKTKRFLKISPETWDAAWHISLIWPTLSWDLCIFACYTFTMMFFILNCRKAYQDPVMSILIQNQVSDQLGNYQTVFEIQPGLGRTRKVQNFIWNWTGFGTN